MIHFLKTWPEHFKNLAEGRKTFESRKDDRGYSVGDILVLREFILDLGEYTGNVLMRQVSHLVRRCEFAPFGYAVMSLGFVAPRPMEQVLAQTLIDTTTHPPLPDVLTAMVLAIAALHEQAPIEVANDCNIRMGRVIAAWLHERRVVMRLGSLLQNERGAWKLRQHEHAEMQTLVNDINAILGVTLPPIETDKEIQ